MMRFFVVVSTRAGLMNSMYGALWNELNRMEIIIVDKIRDQAAESLPAQNDVPYIEPSVLYKGPAIAI